MSIQCPGCGQEYDVTLFQFGRKVRCSCGLEIGLLHQLLAEVHVRHEGSVCVAELSGELRAETIGSLLGSLRSLAELPADGIILDFRGVTFATNSAPTLVLELWKNLRARDTQLVLSGLKGNVRKLFEVTGLVRKLPVFSCAGEALEYFFRER